MTEIPPSPKPPAWWIYNGSGEPHDGLERLPDPPAWRTFQGKVKAETFQAESDVVNAVNAALYLRRPLLVTGKPGTGKSSLAYAVAHELKLGNVLSWSITSRSTLQQGLYQYDAIRRLEDAQRPGGGARKEEAIGRYLRLGPLGTALLPSERPRVLLIDEIDKSDIDLANDLLNVFEEGTFEIPELSRLSATVHEVRVRPADSTGPEDTVPVVDGRVTCTVFPFVVLTSNGEREFPPPFLRRCLRLDIPQPKRDQLAKIVAAHLGETSRQQADALIDRFFSLREKGDLATDQLLNAVYLVTRENGPRESDDVLNALLRYLNSTGSV